VQRYHLSIRFADRYQPLPRFTARTRFLITVQIPILESYHSRISSSLDAFETLSSSFVRAVPGALSGQVGHGSDTRTLTGGVEGLGRLVKAGVSAHYIAAEMNRWGEDLFFLELWSEISARAALRAKADAHPLLPDPSGDATLALQDVEAASEGTIFQELVTQYRSLGERAEDMIVRHVCLEVNSASKAYFTR
jgi:RAD50-interacting protein 1